MLSHKFDFLEPKSGQMPAHLALQFFEPLHRARKLLTHRSNDELKVGATLLNIIPRNPKFRNLDHEAFDTEPSLLPLPNGKIIEGWPAANAITQLAHNIDNIKLADYPELKKGQWYELFAILALSFANQAIQVDLRRTEQNPSWIGDTPEEMINGYIQEYAASAFQAIALAEGLQNLTQSQRMGGKKRHALVEPLKNAVTELVIGKYGKRSARDAANRAFIDLETSERLTYSPTSKCLYFDGLHVLTNDDPQHLFEKWIGKIRGNNSLVHTDIQK